MLMDPLGTPDPDTILGGAAADTIRGFRGADYLTGGTGNDTIFGGRGGDTIAGMDGSDVLFGGKGSDSFVFVGGDSAVDWIGDFNPRKDKLLFADIDLGDVSYGNGVLRVDGEPIAVLSHGPKALPEDVFGLF